MYVPPEQRNVYAHFDLTEEEKRILLQNRGLEPERRVYDAEDPEEQGKIEVDEMGAQHMKIESVRDLVKLEELPPAAAASSSSSSSVAAGGDAVMALLGRPLKEEVKKELEEMDEIQRAVLGLRRLEREEEENFQNQLRSLDRNKMNKQL